MLLSTVVQRGPLNSIEKWTRGNIVKVFIIIEQVIYSVAKELETLLSSRRV